MAITHLCGSFIIHAYGSFLNGGESVKEGKETISMPKTYKLNGKIYPYISAQCWRRWWRLTFENQYFNKLSEDPGERNFQNLRYINAIDDLFGYYESADILLDMKDVGKVNISQIRSSPVQLSQLFPIQENGFSKQTSIMKDKAYIHLKDGTPLPYTSRFYNTDLFSILSIDLNRIGTFKNFNDRIELNENVIKFYIENNFLKEISHNNYEITQIATLRKARILKLMNSLLLIGGGAKSTQFGTDIIPKVLILVGQSGANPVLSNCYQRGREKISINIKLIKERILKFSHLFKTPIFCGIRKNFIENVEELKNFAEDLQDTANIRFVVCSPGDILKNLEEVLA